MTGGQAAMLWAGTILPVAGLALLSVALPRLLAPVFGTGRRGRALLFAAAALILFLVSGGYFLALTLAGAPGSGALMAREPLAALRHFARLGLAAGLIWAPLLAVAFSALAPRRH